MPTRMYGPPLRPQDAVVTEVADVRTGSAFSPVDDGAETSTVPGACAGATASLGAGARAAGRDGSGAGSSAI